ncbi:MAG TPA: hypothetical protein VJ933_04070 [Phaeodactylibacter sp.]|nr:hypothetical protein [Phaeodactylibacter sp.]
MKTLTTIAAMAVCLSLYADTFEISYDVRNDNEVVFNYAKSYPGAVTLRIEFSTLSNCLSQREFIKVIDGPSGVLFTLRPTDPEKRIQFRYRYRYFYGALLKDYQPYEKYLLPFPEGSKVTAEQLYNIEERYFGAKQPDNWYALRLSSDKPDTVHAVRTGKVTKVTKHHPLNKAYHYTSNRNEVIIEHQDGTRARYVGFAPDEIFMAAGNLVYAGEPIGVMREGGQHAALDLFIYYTKSIDFDFQGPQTFDQKAVQHEYVEPTFIHMEGASSLTPHTSFRVTHPVEAITAEMTRREQKRYRKGKLGYGG